MVERKQRGSELAYKIAFKQWKNPKYDEWVAESSLMPVTPDTREKQRLLAFYNTKQGREQQQAEDERKRREADEATEAAEAAASAARARGKRHKCNDDTATAAAAAADGDGAGALAAPQLTAKAKLKAKLESNTAVQEVMRRLSSDTLVRIPAEVQQLMLEDAEQVKFESHLAALPKQAAWTVHAHLAAWHRQVKNAWASSKGLAVLCLRYGALARMLDESL